MLSFSQYLNSRHTKLRGPKEIELWLPNWLQSLQETLAKLHNKNLISARIFTICTQRFGEWQNNPIRYIKQQEKIEGIDALYQQMIFFISNDMAFSRRKLEILGGYPFSSRVSGVELEVRLVMQEEPPYEFMHKKQTASAVGALSNSVNFAQQIKTRIGAIAWIQDSMKHFNFSIADLSLNKPHAELIWCVAHSEDLLNYLNARPIFKKLPRLNDEFPYEQLIQTPRLEIITTSACCGHCRMLFKGLRWTLEKNKIHLPIVLYADSPYNNTQIHNEMQGSVYVILSSGMHFNTQMQCDVPNCEYPVQEKIPLEMRVPKNMSSKEQVDYLCLLYIGGLSLMDLLAYGLPEENFDTINTLTYIAPDAFILYAAEQLPNRKNMSPSLFKAIQYLAKTLEQIDLKVLIYWRLTFTDQLHWLLLSQRHHKFQDNARRSLSATNLSFLNEKNVHGNNDAALFYKCFSLLWKTIENLQEEYHRMVDYYTTERFAKMPLGSIVGPLSNNMRNRVFSQQAKKPERAILYNAHANRPELTARPSKR